MRRIITFLLSSCLIALAPAPADAASGEGEQARRDCRELVFPVHTTIGTQTVGGRLCTPVGAPVDAVQFLLSGGTYNRIYWDYDYQPERFSYARYANAAGYATFAFDRLGVGVSSRPPGAVVTADLQAEIAGQVADRLRNGSIGGRPYPRVVVVGHSFGSAVAAMLARDDKVDAAVITGLQHRFAPLAGFVEGSAEQVYPAMFDQRFTGQGIDPTWMTTRPGGRERLFYAPGEDRGIIDRDEATKDLVSSGEISSTGTVLLDGTTSRIRVPVLLVSGSKDIAFCGQFASDCSSADSIRAHEGRYYRAARRFDVVLVEGAGHAINTSHNARDFFVAAQRWLDEVCRSGSESAQREDACRSRIT